MRNNLLKTVLLSAILLAFAATGRAEIFTAYLSAAQEVPTNASTATGYARINVDAAAGTLTFTVVYNNLTSAQNNAHIHAPAAIGANGSPIISFGVVGGTSGTITGTAAVTPAQLAQLRAHQAYVNVHSVNFPGGEIRGQLGVQRPVDYDGDGRTDMSVLRFPTVSPPGVAQITYHNRNSTSGYTVTPFGDANTDFPAPGDYDGDGKGDIAVYRGGATAGAQSKFYILRSSDGFVSVVDWGLFGDVAISRDYDGDGKTDPAIFRRGPTVGSQASFYIKESTTGLQRVVFFGTTGAANGANGDTPVPGDYDGDGKFDVAVYRFGGLAPNNTYIVLRSSDGTISYTPFGNFQTDWIIPGDYDGDGKYDYAVARTGAVGSAPLDWFIMNSSTGTVTVTRFGLTSDTPFPRGPTQGDYDGDARTDLAVYRQNSTAGAQSYFWVLNSLGNTVSVTPWGITGDFAVNNFDAR